MLPCRLIRVAAGATRRPIDSRQLSTSGQFLKKQDIYPPRIQIPDADIKHSFVLGSGPGGQVINKTASAAQLTHLPTGIVVKSQATRSRTQNYKLARRILADKVDEHLHGKDSRPALKQERKSKKKQSADKKKRRKYRKLDEGMVDSELGEVGEAGDEAALDESSRKNESAVRT
ncbi:uncharacterized protein HMPREF1541_04378 [Cyphellophora europaea CBS 101466]|uniref:Prokaryotic-type class I peptide chain release factors domain-containing protein n=1 Tax=Cyphellophora europaea (strain CBS 101466) TaxID=1220924 RepID=W2RWF6_CYPE1|nr:uncharacterized protein HMPREF1541_04378 [Cyphellophora europaea CBS 101466]ETN40103.1 hypothetical protein HMPREF1541_04378 [Cyphellophora europaea CBS 101466]